MDHVNIYDSLWIRFKPEAKYPMLRILQETLAELGCDVLYLEGLENLPAVMQAIRRTSKHIILDSPRYLPHSIYRLLNERGNFSMGLCDWWAFPHWTTCRADYLFFRHYNGIAARLERQCVPVCGPTPLVSRPETLNGWNVLNTVLRLPYLAAFPFVAALWRWQRQRTPPRPERLLYFPFAIRNAQTPAGEPSDPEWDFANVGATTLYAVMRDPFAPARLSFVNLYSDRRRAIDAILRFEGDPFRVFDSRRTPVWGESTSAAIRKSRFAIATGGIHGASITKLLEIPALGTPIIGSKPPAEFPAIRDCVFELNIFELKRGQLKKQLAEALDMHPSMKQRTLEAGPRILELYDQKRLLRLLQDQYDGKPVPSEYLSPEGKSTSVRPPASTRGSG